MRRFLSFFHQFLKLLANSNNVFPSISHEKLNVIYVSKSILCLHYHGVVCRSVLTTDHYICHSEYTSISLKIYHFSQHCVSILHYNRVVCLSVLTTDHYVWHSGCKTLGLQSFFTGSSVVGQNCQRAHFPLPRLAFKHRKCEPNAACWHEFARGVCRHVTQGIFKIWVCEITVPAF